MPDILIRGMEMPHIYDTVRFAMDVGSGKMFALNLYDETAEWHPVEELPPHGDLIDRDALLSRGKNNPFVDSEIYHPCVQTNCREIVMDEPVVVPAERREEDGD